ncbi:MAG: hypothetical protein GX620_05310 [Chloroflexi bacterium]|nr:hypothetical protein [Chloroflexota bacterium]
MKVDRQQFVDTLPPEWPEDLTSRLCDRMSKADMKVVVLDDDPTGTQTVHDVTVLTGWSEEALARELLSTETVVYVLTNTRAMPLTQAAAVNREIAANLRRACRATGREFVVVSRSDSTLRGHYPGEVEALIDGLEQAIDGVLIVPFFLEGGRYTAGDTHYVEEEGWLMPAAETPYAQDPVFGYSSSNLKAWVSEKTGGRIAPDDVASISLDTIRCGGPEAVATELVALTDGRVCVVNAMSYCDLEVLVAGILQAEATGARFIYRTAASFVRVRGGIAARGLLTSSDLAMPGHGGGLIVVGSFVEKTTRQVEVARLQWPDMCFVEVTVARLLAECERHEEIDRAIGLVEGALEDGRDAMVCTSRQLIAGPDRVTSLRIGQIVSRSLVSIVAGLSVRPRWMIAKGGITSSDIATDALGVGQARVWGQAIPGVPIWRLGSESHWPNLTYVVFPGNVGTDDAIADMIRILRGW